MYKYKLIVNSVNLSISIFPLLWEATSYDIVRNCPAPHFIFYIIEDLKKHIISSLQKSHKVFWVIPSPHLLKCPSSKSLNLDSVWSGLVLPGGEIITRRVCDNRGYLAFLAFNPPLSNSMIYFPRKVKLK